MKVKSKELKQLKDLQETTVSHKAVPSGVVKTKSGQDNSSASSVRKVVKKKTTAKTAKVSLPKGKVLSEKKNPVVPVVKTPELATHTSRMEFVRPAPMMSIPIEDDYDLPQHYNETSIILLARDPHWLHLYWEISARTWQEMRDRFGDELNRARIVLRVYDVTYIHFNGYNANHSFDIEVGPFAMNWYINLWSDNTSYCVDIAAILPNGYYHLIARSNSVTTPRATVSYRDDLIWLEVKDDEHQNPYVNVNFRRGRSGSSGYGKRRLFLTDEEIRRYYEKYFFLMRKVLSQRPEQDFYNDHGGHFQDMFVENTDVSLDDVLDEEWLASGAGAAGGEPRTVRIRIGASEEMTQVMRDRRPVKRIQRFGPEGIGGISGASGLGLGGSENLGGASEGKVGQSAKARNFFFEIGTELIVYGRTEPDARVTLGGQEIQLRPDGTFTLRFALGDQTIPLNFLAESSNQIDKRRISTSVIRTPTEYQSEG